MADITKEELLKRMFGLEGMYILLKTCLELKNQINVINGDPEVTNQQFLNYLKTESDNLPPFLR